VTTTLTVEQPPHAVHTDGPADDELLHELAEHGLRRYTAQVAMAIGTGPEAAWCEWADAPSAYIAVDGRLPEHPDRDAALTWTAERGWAVAVEPARGDDMLVTAALTGDVLPPADVVATWLRAVLAGRRTHPRPRPIVAARANLAHRLANWAEPAATTCAQRRTLAF
jgi:hypothetical protein